MRRGSHRNESKHGAAQSELHGMPTQVMHGKIMITIIQSLRGKATTGCDTRAILKYGTHN
jgi:hypothetical protein